MKIDFKNWDIMRILRLVISVFGFIAFGMSLEPMYGIIAVILLIQTVFNMGCGVGTCGYPAYKRTTEAPSKNITYETIK